MLGLEVMLRLNKLTLIIAPTPPYVINGLTDLQSFFYNMKQVGNAIYHTHFSKGLIHIAPPYNKVHAVKHEDVQVVCYLKHGTTHEQKLFLQNLQETVDPIDNPRNLLHRKSGKRFWVPHDYHTVPRI